MLTDSFSRHIDYLRLSVTESCNLKCRYCVPAIPRDRERRPETMDDDEVMELVSCLVDLGISRVRITGGEPLLRPGIVRLIARLSRLEGIRDLSLSTNGLLMAARARKLKAAGLKRVNFSIDTLDPERFHMITRSGTLDPVLAGIRAALDERFSPVKLNVVVARGMNEDEIPDFVRLTEGAPIHVRFIELMPMGAADFFSPERRVPLNEMMDRASPLLPLDKERWPVGHGPARYFKRPGAVGTVGFISALSRRFCGSCNRVRLTADGVLIPCLDASEGIPLRAPRRAGKSRKELEEMVLRAVASKPERHRMIERARESLVEVPFMCRIGG